MSAQKKQQTTNSSNTNLRTSEKNTDNGENVIAAREEAASDIEKDPDFSLNDPNDDLDEGESARLGEDKTDLV